MAILKSVRSANPSNIHKHTVWYEASYLGLKVQEDPPKKRSH